MRVAVNLVMVDVTAKTKAGQILGDLKKEDFELREDGAPQKVEIFSRDELPLNVALVLDLSDSIEPFLGPLRDAANTALGALKPEKSTRSKWAERQTSTKASLPPFQREEVLPMCSVRCVTYVPDRSCLQLP